MVNDDGSSMIDNFILASIKEVLTAILGPVSVYIFEFGTKCRQGLRTMRVGLRGWLLNSSEPGLDSHKLLSTLNHDLKLISLHYSLGFVKNAFLGYIDIRIDVFLSGVFRV